MILTPIGREASVGVPAVSLRGRALPVGLLFSVLAAVSLMAAAPAHAQVVDLAATKCKEFLELKQDRVGFILMWLDGYYTADEDPVVVDFDQAKTKVEKLGAYCAQHPTLNVITAAESVLGKP
jgi:acid stress chaperone HdeB